MRVVCRQVFSKTISPENNDAQKLSMLDATRVCLIPCISTNALNRAR